MLFIGGIGHIRGFGWALMLVGWADKDVGDLRYVPFSLLGLCKVNSNLLRLGVLGVWSGYIRFCADLPGVPIEFVMSIELESCNGQDCAPSTTETLVTLSPPLLFP